MKYFRIIFSGIYVFALVLMTNACNSSAGGGVSLGVVTDYRSEQSQPLARDSQAPDFQMKMPDGNTVHLNELRGKVILLNFWAVDCPYCVKEMPYLQQAYNELSSRGVLIIGINTGEPEKTVRKFVLAKNITFPVILDPDVYASMLYGARYLPTTIIIDKDGNIADGQIGAFESAAEIIDSLRVLLQ